MSDDVKFNIFREVNEIRNQLTVSKSIGFFFGAGTSKALGLPDINQLTKEVEENLKPKEVKMFNDIKNTLQIYNSHNEVTIEDVLNQIRLIRKITRELDTKEFDGINGIEAKELDISICNKIYDCISKKENGVDLSTMKKFVAWLNWLSRDYSKEIFTTNYDLIIEESLEDLKIPYFDGFVGANEPFFFPESIESDLESPPFSWIRLWKLHGSLGWFWEKADDLANYKAVRLGAMAKKVQDNHGLINHELIIYPSREKYESSRKQPFVAYFDRLKQYLGEGEKVFIIIGYSFSDEHINEIIFNSLRRNNRLHVMAFMYTDDIVDKIKDSVMPYLNISIYGPNKAIITGFYGKWSVAEGDCDISHEIFWDGENKRFTLGDFIKMVDFLIETSGEKEKIELGVGADND